MKKIMHVYTIWTDSESEEIRARSLDHAVRQFSGRARDWAGLCAEIDRCGDGAWVRADSDTDPAACCLYHQS